MPRILLVDDDNNLLQMVKLMLNGRAPGRNVNNAADGLERAALIQPI